MESAASITVTGRYVTEIADSQRSGSETAESGG